MQTWQIVLTVIAAVIVVLVAAFFIGAFSTLDHVLGRRRTPVGFSDKYGVDKEWFEEMKGNMTELELTAYDGIKLSALLISHGEGIKKVAVCQHGYGSSPLGMQPHAKIFYDNGFDVLLPIARGHEGSEGKYCGLAWIDRFDVMRWVNKTIEMYGKSVEIALLGVSMGGSTVIAVAGMNPPPQVKCVIDDCGFSSQFDEYSSRIEKVKLPKKLALLPLAAGVRLVCGYSIYDADITELAKNVTVPALFIHGDKDAFVPYALGVKLYDACGSQKKSFYTAVGAEHAQAYAVDKEKYAATVVEFVDGAMQFAR